MRKIRSILLILVCGFCCYSKSVQSQNSDSIADLSTRSDTIADELDAEKIEWLKANNEVTFTGDPDWLPFEAFTEDGDYIGIVASYLDELEAILGITIQKIPVNLWLETLERSREGEIDIISGDIDDVVLAENYDPIQPYILTPIVIVMRDDEVFVNDLHDISEKKISIMDGAGFSSKIYENYPDLDFYKIKTFQEGLEGVSVGHFDAMVLSLPKAGYNIRTKGYNNLKVVGKTNVTMKVTLFVRKDKPILHRAIDEAMKTIPSKTNQAILKEWMQVEFAKKVDYKLIAEIISVFLIISLLFIYWNRKISYARKEAVIQKTKYEDLAVKLSRYLSAQIYDMLFKGKEEGSLSPRRKKLTIFFSDIAGFTNMTERLESEELTHLLNNYLTEMTDIALKYGATVDKYIGDAIVIFFGDPISQGYREDALNCVNMAIEMQHKLKEIQADIVDQGIAEDFKIRIGINTGYCTVGNFGSSNRMDYTIIGKAVNIASRLESNAAHDSILISHETWSLVKHEVECVPQKPIQVKGISQDLRTYLVTGLKAGARKHISVDEPGLRVSIDKASIDQLNIDKLEEVIEMLNEARADLKQKGSSEEA